MIDKILTALCLITLCCLLTLNIGCGGSGAATGASILSGHAIHETVGGVYGRPPTDTPLTNTKLSFHAPSSSVAVVQATTDSSGAYKVSLPPGTYAVDLAVPANQPLYNTVTPQQIVVAAGMSYQVDITFVEDTP